MLPFKTVIEIDKLSKTPLYQQIGIQLINLIQTGLILPGKKLPSSRELSSLLGLHRKTITQTYEDLILQGWLDSKTGGGTFVAKNLPQVLPQNYLEDQPKTFPKHAGFIIEKKQLLQRPLAKHNFQLHLDDGFPDPQFAPLQELTKAYRAQLTLGNKYFKLGYTDTKGSLLIREELAKYLNDTRGLRINAEQIMIVRGTIMGLYLAARTFLKPNDLVVVPSPTWLSAKITFMEVGAKIVTVPVDQYGIIVEKLEEICLASPVRMIYCTPHHHYPTTVVMRPERRLQLQLLAQKYRFIIFEDDYDYDFHYQNKPLLPLATGDKHGLVIYSGSFTKSISPAFRVGYLVAPTDAIEQLSYHRRIIDRQGDTILENAIAILLKEGVIEKYLRQALKEYKKRRDYFCDLLKHNCSNYIKFQVPEGGMSVWGLFDKSIKMEVLSDEALKKGLYISSGVQFNETEILNGTRMGFASSSMHELEECIKILKISIEKQI